MFVVVIEHQGRILINLCFIFSSLWAVRAFKTLRFCPAVRRQTTQFAGHWCRFANSPQSRDSSYIHLNFVGIFKSSGTSKFARIGSILSQRERHSCPPTTWDLKWIKVKVDPGTALSKGPKQRIPQAMRK